MSNTATLPLDVQSVAPFANVQVISMGKSKGDFLRKVRRQSTNDATIFGEPKPAKVTGAHTMAALGITHDGLRRLSDRWAAARAKALADGLV